MEPIEMSKEKLIILLSEFIKIGEIEFPNDVWFEEETNQVACYFYFDEKSKKPKISLHPVFYEKQVTFVSYDFWMEFDYQELLRNKDHLEARIPSKPHWSRLDEITKNVPLMGQTPGVIRCGN